MNSKWIALMIAALAATDAAADQTAKLHKHVILRPIDTLKPAISSVLPSSVKLPSGYGTKLPPVAARPFFDYFSWQSFIALAWPADPNPANRGLPLAPNAPSTFMKAYSPIQSPTDTPAVFMSWRDVTQLFPPSGVPVGWNSSSPAYSVCNGAGPNTPYIGDSIASDTNQAGLYAADDSPVVDQHGNYARYETKFNQIEYSTVLANQWYVSTNTTITLPVGSIEIKAAWRKMQAGDDLSRYYVVNMLATDPNTPMGQQGACVVQPMGLIGFHIMQKTQGQPQWIWSTFEQVDNVGFNNQANQPGSFTNGNPDAATQKYGFSYKPAQLPPTLTDPAPVNLYRVTPIPTTPTGTARYFPNGISTSGMNQTYRALLANTVWANYQLVATQWPAHPAQIPQGGVPFPSSSVANTVIESFGLTASNPTCMGCHSAAASGGNSRDYSWTLAIRPQQAPATRVKPGH